MFYPRLRSVSEAQGSCSCQASWRREQ